MRQKRNNGGDYAPGSTDAPSSNGGQSSISDFDTSEFAKAAAPAGSSKSPEDTFDFLKLAMEEMGAAPAPEAAPQPAAPSYGGPLDARQPGQVPAQFNQAPAQAQQPDPDLPVNPLVAARANAAGASITASGGGGLYPISDVEPQQGQRSFDTSFGTKKSHKGRIVLIILLLALLAVGAFFGLRYLKGQEAQTKLNAAIERLSDSDEVIVPLDRAIGTEIETNIASNDLAGIMELSTTTSTALNDAESLANEAASAGLFLDEKTANAIEQVKNSVKARRSMLEVGKMLLAADTKTGSTLEILNAAYESNAAATERVGWALGNLYGYVDASNAGQINDENYGEWNQRLWDAVGIGNDALGLIQSAQASAAAAKESLPEADLSALDQYLSARHTHIEQMIQMITTLANGDVDTFWGLVDGVNQADANQAAAFANVPANAAELLADAYAEMTESQRQAYEIAREACVAADSSINEYRGLSMASPETTSEGAADTGAAPAAEGAPATVADTAAPAAETAPADGGVAQDQAAQDAGAQEGAQQEGTVA